MKNTEGSRTEASPEASPTIEDEASPIGQRMKRRRWTVAERTKDEASPMKCRRWSVANCRRMKRRRWAEALWTTIWSAVNDDLKRHGDLGFWSTVNGDLKFRELQSKAPRRRAQAPRWRAQAPRRRAKALWRRSGLSPF